jgi:hypothetical protein
MSYIKPYFSFISLNQTAYLATTVLIACLLYQFLDYQTLKHSAALFIGIPLFMSITLATNKQTKHQTLHIMLGLSLGLLASFLYLNEGSFCVPMTAPLFLVTGFIVSYSFCKFRQSAYTKPVYILPVILLSILSVEGINSFTSFNRYESVQYSKVTSLTPLQIQKSLSENKQFTNIPLLLSWGFPQPQQIVSSGNSIGDSRTVYFSGGEGKPGNTIFTITNRTSNSIEYSLLKDESHISHWLKWKTSVVNWETLASGKSRITWTINYERKLDPSWYFGPLQAYAVKLSSKALIDNLILAN